MTAYWFCQHCLREGALEVEPTASVWSIVDAVRRDHWSKSYRCHDFHGVESIRLNDGKLYTASEWQTLKDDARKQRGQADAGPYQLSV